MLFKILDLIRSKPKHVREQYAFGIAIFCTMAIGGVWSLSLPARFESGTQVAALASTTNAAPFSNFFTQLKAQFSNVKQGIDELKVATTTTPLTVASSTQAALEMQLSPENIEQLKENQASATSTEFQYGSDTQASSTPPKQTILIATTSATTTPRNPR